MVATVIIREWNDNATNTGSPTKTDKTSGNVRFRNNDSASTDNANRLIIPTADREYSFKKYLRLAITVVPDVDIDNIQAYTDGAPFSTSTGVKLWYQIDGTFATPIVPTESNDPPQNSTAGVFIIASGITSGTPANMDAINTGPFATTGDIGDFLKLVLEVETNAVQGDLTAEVLTWSFDET